MNNFTPRAQQTLALARKEADRLNHNYVGTEHLLLGLLRLGQGGAVNVLQKLGLEIETVRTEVEKQVGLGPEKKLAGNIPYTPRVKKVLALAGKEAKLLEHNYVGTEHMLLGLIREGDGLAARVLKTLGVDMERARAEVLRELEPGLGANSVRAASPTVQSFRRPDRPALTVPPHASGGEDRQQGLPDNLTPRSRQVLAMARKEALRFNQKSVGTEHLLLGLINLGQGVAVNVLQKLGLDLEKVRGEVEKQIEPATGSETCLPAIRALEAEIGDLRSRKETAIREHDFEKASDLRDAEMKAKEKLTQMLNQEPPGGLPYSETVKTVLEVSALEAKALNHSYIGTEHILLALLRQGNSRATQILRSLGADLDQTRNVVLGELDPNHPSLSSVTDQVKAKVRELDARIENAATHFHLKKLENEMHTTREELLKKLDKVTETLDALKAEIAYLRDEGRRKLPENPE